ncbi:hypothetical protein GTA08_BOTSDO11926 [Neofusicoccum parvum]|uniref:non-specific serine/threonine protein kinase n=2 Tax=Neofusicoccum parvum TaxID=310453 RepID=R1E8H5_BOTPV|nr:putative protein kinase protein [Neofusicoccum parvum UCRNP2]GME29269.1 hypothetical protein GTA08_BOTSDO11926 [Neofusicoccum parvum]GME65276.1 hypothetical protein GTA08_BOTSDO11926 [Neofusicoccum parvum]
MSLVPRVNRGEIVLRHGQAVVVYDERSRQLSLRARSSPSDVELANPNCPYCHRPLRDEARSPGEDGHDDTDHGFVNPEYFRMLHHSRPGSESSSRQPSPQRRPPPARRALRQTSGGSDIGTPPPGAEFVGSTPATPAAAHGISSAAFSQNYFKQFFVEEGELGRGGKGVVLLVRHVLDGVSLGHFACKRVPVGDDHEWLEKVLVEVQLLQNLSHQNLVSYRHVWLEDYQISAFGPSVPCAFILQQYCNAGDLHHYILNQAQESVTTQQLKERMRRRSKGQAEPPLDLHSPRRMPFEQIFSFFKDITAGLHHLHAHGYIHRDLKPHNCLLHTTGTKTRVLVSDFGEVQMVNVVRKSTGHTGTISYCAPEVLRRETPDGQFGNFSTKSDIFSLGMIVYFMCFGKLPYQNVDDFHEENEDLELLRAEIASWEGFDDVRKVRPNSSPPDTPRLMLPPPSNFASNFALHVHNFFAIPVVASVLKLAMFLIKVLTLSRPCAPFATNPWVSYPLLCLAALDFGFLGAVVSIPLTANGSSWRFQVGLVGSLVLLAVHFVMTAVAARWDCLCMRNSIPTVGVDWNDFESGE